MPTVFSATALSMLAFVASRPISSSIWPAPQPVHMPGIIFENDLEPV
jgi:hypothetical protein